MPRVRPPRTLPVSFRCSLDLMPRPCTACTHPDAAAVDEVLVSGASYRAVALAFGLNLSAIFRHARRHLAAPIRRRPCDVCREPLGAGESVRHAACREAAKAEARRRVLDARKRRRAAEAWLRRGDARWSSDPELRRRRQVFGLCVVCALDRPADRHWCCSREHEVLRRHTLRRVLS